MHLLSTTTFHVQVKERYLQMRTLKWDTWFEPDMETTIRVARISFPDLPPNFFANEAIFFNCCSNWRASNSRFSDKEPNQAKLCKGEGGGGLNCKVTTKGKNYRGR